MSTMPKLLAVATVVCLCALGWQEVARSASGLTQMMSGDVWRNAQISELAAYSRAWREGSASASLAGGGAKVGKSPKVLSASWAGGMSGIPLYGIEPLTAEEIAAGLKKL